MNNAFKIALASTVALTIAAPALAQSQYQPTPESQQQQQQYQDQQQQYQQQRDAYDQRKSDYDQNRQGYAAARANYEQRLDAYNRARADYDRRYGYGAYVRVYGVAPAWDESHWAYYAPGAPAAPYYGANTAYAGPPIHCDNSSTVGAGVIGALAGAVLGSQLSAPGRHTENAVLGGVVGAGIGAAVGHAHDKYRCDQRGPYFAYNETIPYREDNAYRTPRYAEYNRMGCRLATAPIDADGRDYRYVRVCPDRDGRYRIMG
ncbi:MAG: glycine zipper 2TM domain-containing protein [Phenylobacterium sp.]|nr:MAG: glycine zipper 2TM domain-containing protein [Phenylobacterium sp.]